MSIKTLTGGNFQDSGGNHFLSGTIMFQLSAPAVVTGTGQVVQDIPIIYSLDASGNIVLSNPTPSLWFNDQLTPAGTYYVVTIRSANGIVRGPENWVLAGSAPLDLATIVAASSSVSYPAPSFAPAVVVVPFSATPIFAGPSLLPNLVISFTMLLTGNVTSSSLTNITAGAIVIFDITQDGSGGHTFAWPTNVLGAMVVDPIASAVSIQSFYFDGTNCRPLAPGTVS